MKKILFGLVAGLAAMGFSFSSNAQVLDGARFGVIGGITSSSTKIKNVTAKSISLYHIGVAAELPVGGGFVIQPALMYQVKGARMDKAGDKSLNELGNSFDRKVGYVELPVQLQWGPDLVYFRPYVFAEPFLGYQLSENNTFKIGDKKTNDEKIKEIGNLVKKESKKLEYGLSLGAGLELGRFQFSAKYFWNFGKMFDGKQDISDKAYSTVKEALKQGNNFNGISVSVAVFF